MRKFIEKWLSRPGRLAEYIFVLLVFMVTFWMMSFFVIYYQWERGALFRYGANIILIILVLIEDRFVNWIYEWLYQKIKQENLIKRHLRKHLATYRWHPSIKSALYLYYIVCLVAGRILYLRPDLFPDWTIVQSSRSYFEEMYYVLILLVASDKFKDYITKENKYRDKYYRRYEEEQIELGDNHVDK